MIVYCPLCKTKHKLPIKGRELKTHRVKLINSPLELVDQWIALKTSKQQEV